MVEMSESNSLNVSEILKKPPMIKLHKKAAWLHHVKGRINPMARVIYLLGG